MSLSRHHQFLCLQREISLWTRNDLAPTEHPSNSCYASRCARSSPDLAPNPGARIFRLHQLHRVLQVVFSRLDYHLYSFEVDGREFQAPDPEAEYDTEDATTMRLRDLKLGAASHFMYVYDFGDDWRHDVVVERLLPMPPERGLDWSPRLLGGDRAAPPCCETGRRGGLVRSKAKSLAAKVNGAPGGRPHPRTPAFGRGHGGAARRGQGGSGREFHSHSSTRRRLQRARSGARDHRSRDGPTRGLGAKQGEVTGREGERRQGRQATEGGRGELSSCGAVRRYHIQARTRPSLTPSSCCSRDSPSCRSASTRNFILWHACVVDIHRREERSPQCARRSARSP